MMCLFLLLETEYSKVMYFSEFATILFVLKLGFTYLFIISTCLKIC